MIATLLFTSINHRSNLNFCQGFTIQNTDRSRRIITSLRPFMNFSPFHAQTRTHLQIRSQTKLNSQSLPNWEELSQQKSEALRSLSDYHDGTWKSDTGALSFSTRSDVMAGITSKRLSVPYRCSVSTRLGLLGGESDNEDETGGEEAAGLKLVETFYWESTSKGATNPDDDDNNTSSTCLAVRTLPLGRSVDIDSVDGSYSVDHMCPPSCVIGSSLPPAISGVDPSMTDVSFLVEHTIAVSEEERVRCFLLYGEHKQNIGISTDNVKSSSDPSQRPTDGRLVRVVVCNEKKVVEGGTPSSNTASFQEETNMSSIMSILKEDEEDRMEQLARVLGDQKKGKNNDDMTDDSNLTMERYPISMFGLSLGPWLGDAIIRDRSKNDLLPTSKSSSKTKSNKPSYASKGFGASSSDASPKSIGSMGVNDGFAEWALGVQKVAMTFKWDFGDTVRQVFSWGRSIGSYTSEQMSISSMGVINEEGMSRRLKPEERSMYIDYDGGSAAGFIVGSVYIRAPRFLTFSDQSLRRKETSTSPAFFTEFAVFQKSAIGSEINDVDSDNRSVTMTSDLNMDNLDELFCSRMTRLYGRDGWLTQGSTSFFTLKPVLTDSFEP